MARELTEKQQLFLAALVPAMGDIREAMRVAGYADSASASALVKALREEIVELANTTLASGAVSAALGLTGILSDPAQIGAKEKLAAAKEILDRTGLVKVDKAQMEITTPNGIFILPAKKED